MVIPRPAATSPRVVGWRADAGVRPDHTRKSGVADIWFVNKVRIVWCLSIWIPRTRKSGVYVVREIRVLSGVRLRWLHRRMVWWYPRTRTNSGLVTEPPVVATASIRNVKVGVVRNLIYRPSPLLRGQRPPSPISIFLLLTTALLLLLLVLKPARHTNLTASADNIAPVVYDPVAFPSPPTGELVASRVFCVGVPCWCRSLLLLLLSSPVTPLVHGSLSLLRGFVPLCPWIYGWLGR
tara:strand:+ start:13486 stop:14196 length:711 start_codon:yes stop_codon:yes gene_type:complete